MFKLSVIETLRNIMWSKPRNLHIAFETCVLRYLKKTRIFLNLPHFLICFVIFSMLCGLSAEYLVPFT